MIVVLTNDAGKIFQEVVQGTYTLEEAQKEFDNDIFRVVSVQEEKFGDYSNGRAASIIENEGIGYAVTSYCSYKEFTDPKTRKLWKQADDILNELSVYVGTDV